MMRGFDFLNDIKGRHVSLLVYLTDANNGYCWPCDTSTTSTSQSYKSNFVNLKNDSFLERRFSYPVCGRHTI